MLKMEFVSPEGRVADVHPAHLKKLMLFEGEDFWSSGAGQATVGVEEPGAGPKLVLTFAPPASFFLEFVDREKKHLFPLVDPGSKESVIVEVGGDPYRLPMKSVVGRQVAWEVVEEFCTTSKLSSKLNWVNRKTLNWDFDPEAEASKG